MGVIDRIINAGPGITAAGNAISGVAEVFTQNETRRMELDEEAHARALDQLGKEFVLAPQGWFDAMVNGLNRLPRPMLALGTMGLFVYAMAEPAGFGLRMQGLAAVPEPLWWLLGAIVSFYFGAREAHYLRLKGRVTPREITVAAAVPAPAMSADEAEVAVPQGEDFADNAALRDWAASRSR